MSNTVLYWRRFFIFLLKNLLIILLLLLLIMMVFFSAMHMSNCYFMVQDGMEARAEVAFNEKDSDTLERFFSPELMKQINFVTDAYKNYTISFFNYKLKVESLQLLPWYDTATVTVIEYVKDLEGEINELGKSNNASKEVPAWQPARYRLTLKRTGSFFSLQSHWMIERVEFVEKVNMDTSSLVTSPQAPSPVITPSASMPAATPSASPAAATATPTAPAATQKK